MIAEGAATALSPILRVRLSLLMFLQYFMFGTWFMTLGTYMSRGLGFDDIIGTAYGTQGIAAILSTLAFGALADSQGSPRRLLALLSAGSGGLLLLVANAGNSRDLFLAALLLHFLLFVPTIPLANALVLSRLSNRSSQFPGIRVCGTVGWIVGGIVIGSMPGAASTATPMLIAGTTGIAMGLYALTLPGATETPTQPRTRTLGWQELLGLSMLEKLRDRNFALFIAGVMVILIPLSFYNTYSNAYLSEIGLSGHIGGKHVEATAIQTLGQVSELLLLMSLPFFLGRFGIKGVLVLGMLAWALRCTLFALGYSPGPGQGTLLLAGVILHGICYDFFFVAGQIYVDEAVKPTERAMAQSFLVTVNMGLGVIVGSNIANSVYSHFAARDGTRDWPSIWLVPAIVSFIAAVLFAALFRLPTREAERTP